MESKRMAGDYTIILSTTTLTGECVIGENINANPDLNIWLQTIIQMSCLAITKI